MGLQYNVQVMDAYGQVTGFSGGILRSQHGQMVFITGMLVEKLAEEGWSQLVGYSTAKRFIQLFGEPGQYDEWRGHFAGELYRITIA